MINCYLFPARSAIRDFSQRRLPAPASQWGPLLEEAGSLNLLRLPFAAAGEGGGQVAFTEALELLSARDVSFAAALMANSSAAHLLQARGSPEQRQQWLDPILQGAALGAIALSEPEAGSELATMTTGAVRDGTHFLLNGEKAFISNASSALSGPILVIAKVETGGAEALGCFIVQAGDSGLAIGPPMETIGWNRVSKGRLTLDACRLSADRYLGPLSPHVLHRVLNLGRTAVAALATGLGSTAFALSKRQVKRRMVDGRPLSQNEAVRWRLADMWANQEVSRILTHQAAQYADESHPNFPLYASLAKLTASEAAFNAARQCIQWHGGAGVLAANPVSDLLGDAKVLEIVEGTSEIQRSLIAHWVLDQDPFGDDRDTC